MEFKICFRSGRGRNSRGAFTNKVIKLGLIHVHLIESFSFYSNRVLDHDTYSSHDAIGKVYIDLKPLVNKNGPSSINGNQLF